MLSSTVLRPAHALSHMKYCQGIESTAEAMACVKDHKEAAQSRLAKSYDALRKQLEKKSAEHIKEMEALANDKINLASQSSPDKANDADQVTDNADAKEEAENPYQLSLDALEAVQKEWVALRDKQCKWDADLAELPSLRRVYELSCITDLTEKRSQYLSGVLGNQIDENPREFGGTPRWMNVLTMENPDVFWRYGQVTRADINCDERDEYIISGVSFKTFHVSSHVSDVGSSDNAVSQADVFHKDKNIVIAVADNPVTGKPKTQILNIPVYTNPENAGKSLEENYLGLCKEHVSMVLAALPEDIVQTDSEQSEQDSESVAEAKKEMPSCAKILQISDHICQPLMLRWSGDAYGLAPLVIQSE